jgi:uncharacterized protein YdeI (YjbR/CyaY-like superfamily)
LQHKLNLENDLKKNHKKATALLVGYYKISSDKPSMTWSQSVDQALCLDWIDGIRKSIDIESYSIRFTPQKNNSVWSAINIQKVEAHNTAGIITRERLNAFSFRTESKSKIYSHEKEPIPLEPTYEKQFKENKLAWNFFIKQAPSYKKSDYSLDDER